MSANLPIDLVCTCTFIIAFFLGVAAERHASKTRGQAKTKDPIIRDATMADVAKAIEYLRNDVRSVERHVKITIALDQPNPYALSNCSPQHLYSMRMPIKATGSGLDETK